MGRRCQGRGCEAGGPFVINRMNHRPVVSLLGDVRGEFGSRRSVISSEREVDLCQSWEAASDGLSVCLDGGP